MTDRDQPRPDLDAAIDAVLPSLSAVSDDAAAASLRRTRAALAEPAPARGELGAWRWAVPLAAPILTALVARTWWPSGTPDESRVAVDERPQPMASPLVPPATSSTPRPPNIAPIVVPPRVIVPEPLVRAPRVVAASVARRDETPRPVEDPLIALTQAVQAIPADAWSAVDRAQAPLSVPELGVAPIVVRPLVTPPFDDASAALPVHGEP